MGRIDRNKAPHRRAVSESAAPSRGQRRRAAKSRKALLTKKFGVAGPFEPTLKVPTLKGGEGDNDVHATTAHPGIKSRSQQVVSNKGKRLLLSAEMGQLTAVLKDADFRKDPFAAVNAHLRHTACPAHPQPVHDTESRKKTKPSKTQRNTKPGVKVRQDKKSSATRHFKGRNAKMRIK